MDRLTARKFIAVNEKFYRTVGKYFDASRHYFWPGWDFAIYKKKAGKGVNEVYKQITKYSAQGKIINVLDIGSGNGRLIEYLVKRFPEAKFSYTAVEGSKELMKKAETRVSELFENDGDRLQVNLILSEIIYGNWYEQIKKNKFDLITMFGIMHHIPGEDNRNGLIKRVERLMKSDAYLVLTTWMFKDVERLHRRIIDLKAPEAETVLNEFELSKDDFGNNDYLLDWHRGRTGYRYCHYYPKDEIEEISFDAGLKIINDFRADGKEESVNHYYVLKKAET